MSIRTKTGADVGGRSIDAIRGDFPILSRSLPNGRSLVYLDNAATTQKPETVIDAVAGYYRRSNANVHRALHTLGEEATSLFEEARALIGRFIGTDRPQEIVFTRGATEAINLVAASWGGANLGEGDEVLLTEMEHHSNLIPWQLVASRTGARLRFIPFLPDGSLDLARLPELLGPRTRLVALVHMSNVFGTVNPVREVIEQAHRRGIPVLVDGAQSVPHMPVDVKEMDCDFFAFSGHKMYGPMGIGALYGKEEILSEMPPWMGGGEMISSVHLDRATWNALPYMFEAGTPNVEGAVGLATAVEYLSALGMEEIAAYEKAVTGYTLEKLGEIDGITIHGTAPERGGVISFTAGDMLHPHDLAQFLDSRGIAVRAGHHCAHPLMRKLGIPATARASISFYNTRGEIDLLADAIREAKEFFGV